MSDKDSSVQDATPEYLAKSLPFELMYRSDTQKFKQSIGKSGTQSAESLPKLIEFSISQEEKLPENLKIKKAESNTKEEPVI
jgi:hypothetical protein